MYFTPEDFFYVFIQLLSQVFIPDAPGISEKDEKRSKSTKVTKVNIDGSTTYIPPVFKYFHYHCIICVSMSEK